MNREEFLKPFSKTETAEALLQSVLLPLFEEVKDVTRKERVQGNYTKGELFVGKEIAAEIIGELIRDIEYYKNKKEKKVDPRDTY